MLSNARVEIVPCCWCEVDTEVPSQDSYYCDECEDQNDYSKIICGQCMSKHYEHGCVLCPEHHAEESKRR